MGASRPWQGGGWGLGEAGGGGAQLSAPVAPPGADAAPSRSVMLSYFRAYVKTYLNERCQAGADFFGYYNERTKNFGPSGR